MNSIFLVNETAVSASAKFALLEDYHSVSNRTYDQAWAEIGSMWGALIKLEPILDAFSSKTGIADNEKAGREFAHGTPGMIYQLLFKGNGKPGDRKCMRVAVLHNGDVGIAFAIEKFFAGSYEFIGNVKEDAAGVVGNIRKRRKGKTIFISTPRRPKKNFVPKRVAACAVA